MCFLRLNDSTISGRIMGNATAALQGSEYKFGSAAILPGPTEAAAGWATANYAQHKAKKFTVRLYTSISCPSQSATVLKRVCFAALLQSGTTGSLDMGGASMEIAFLPADGLAIQPEFLSKEVLFGHSYNLYARSYLCYGQREAHSRLLAALVDVQPKVSFHCGVRTCCWGIQWRVSTWDSNDWRGSTAMLLLVFSAQELEWSAQPLSVQWSNS